MTNKRNEDDDFLMDYLIDELGDDFVAEEKAKSQTAKKKSTTGKTTEKNVKKDAFINTESKTKNKQVNAINNVIDDIVVQCVQLLPFDNPKRNISVKPTIDDVFKVILTEKFYKKLYMRIKANAKASDLELFKFAKVSEVLARKFNNKELDIITSGNKCIVVEPEFVQEIVGVYKNEYTETKIGYEKYTVYSHYIISDLDESKYTIYTMLDNLFPGDKVVAILNQKTNIAYYQKTLTQNNLVLGRLLPKAKLATFISDDKSIGEFSFNFQSAKDLGDAKPGNMVIAEITDRSHGKDFVVTVKEVLGDLERLDVQIKKAITTNGLPHEWNSGIENQLTKIPDEVQAKDKKGRVDLTSLPLVTIDGEDARDFDDAVYCKKVGDNFRLYVAIADVSHYVKTDTPLDVEAKRRGTSVYFPNYVVPMLPEKLSNGLCSLNPHVDRLCMVCEVEIDKHGVLGEYQFYPAVMHSHARFTYTEVASILAGNEPSSDEFRPLVKDLYNLYDLYKALKSARVSRGGIEFEGDEVKFVFDANLEIANIEPVVRNDAHMLIEECMVAANICAAKYVEESQGFTLFRVHAKPTAEKLATFRAYIAQYGLSLGGNDTPSSMDYANFVRSIEGNPREKILCMMMLRSMSLAEYTPENIGHFGLALNHYAHFTSPIRRYPDLQLHREIKYLLAKNGRATFPAMKSIGSKKYTKEELVMLSESCNMTERRADAVTGAVCMVLKAKFMERFIGKALPALVTNVTPFGLFVSIEEFHIDGLIHVSNIGADYYDFIPERQMLVGEASGQKYTLGQNVNVMITSVDLEEGHINMVLAPKQINKKQVAIFDPKELLSKLKGESIENGAINSKIKESLDKWFVNTQGLANQTPLSDALDLEVDTNDVKKSKVLKKLNIKPKKAKARENAKLKEKEKQSKQEKQSKEEVKKKKDKSKSKEKKK